jgi:predicted transcriptional regulator YdeE
MPIIDASFRTVLDQKQSVTIEVRLKKQWHSPDGLVDTWISASSYPVFDGDGTIRSIQGVMSDISSLKWAENVQRKRTEEALEAKRVIEETEARFKTFAESAPSGLHNLQILRHQKC